MTLNVGARLGPYEILSSIGAGGMGEVYRARDPRLNRDVALRVLPHPSLLNADRIARLKREARMLAALNHPNIAAVYGFEESNDIHALVMELVDGQRHRQIVAVKRARRFGRICMDSGAPTKLFEARYVMSTGGHVPRNYDISADGQRFLMLKAGAGDAAKPTAQIVVVQHFDQELKRMVPTK